LYNTPSSWLISAKQPRQDDKHGRLKAGDTLTPAPDPARRIHQLAANDAATPTCAMSNQRGCPSSLTTST
jgi:hypothetical protein